MLPTEDLFVYVYVLVDDGLRSGAIAIPCRGVTGSRRRCARRLRYWWRPVMACLDGVFLDRRGGRVAPISGQATGTPGALAGDRRFRRSGAFLVAEAGMSCVGRGRDAR